ncbi:hypothetical protein DIU31_009385 [Mucilaginibacter rubeus]|uniref:Uncharacterized protein n=1 Tax=Mucilaginibacter rubeus TaxID=2027860 RepID=A0AAE6JDH8_9SPHI|nr:MULTISPECIES: hypothetical protein [Mucilaginibacter]QEM03714.1 hypothetical protein DIU31_009385 [Mucilaginibacter rubeus]QEM16325.1 hypothetical protein DIU38_009480 [Mucilaginibacter gossypii]QTE40910.1 hypothetical protein J3L19_18285 [Mucilaginibacter rubeus]QTE47513.1 hypothetical protein J3L21_18260 [Mucilaginibacter rubeus]QTE58905.1 hypothetical protein J3L23_09925 [Mucilaginibacter rubeus]
MGAINFNNSPSSETPFKDVLANFFVANTPETMKVFAWKIFQCWTLKDCNQKAEISDEKLALFLDQLIGLVAAAYNVHQANNAAETKEGLTTPT